jgi:anti-sigma regulatory factor (Ser/Thr protein kinase)
MEQAGFEHQALIYEGADEYLAGIVPFLWSALEAEEPVLAAVSRERAELLWEELGGDARWVQFVAVEEAGRNPAGLIPLWRSFVDENGGGRVRGLSEPIWRGRNAAAIEECHRQESLFPLVFADDPAFSLLSLFDAAALPAEAPARVGASHRRVRRGVTVEENLRPAAAGEFFAGALSPPACEPEVFHFGVAELGEVRERVAAASRRTGLCSREVADLVTAASELAANSVIHGGGGGTLRLWSEGGTLLTEVEDRGLIEDPLVGRLRPAITQDSGRGLWLANQLCDLVQIRSGEGGTVVRLHLAAGASVAGSGPPPPSSGPWVREVERSRA